MKKDSIESSRGSIHWKKHSRSLTTNSSRPRERSVKGVRASILDEYVGYKEVKTERFMTNMMKLDYIIKNAKEISDILDFELPPESPESVLQPVRAHRLRTNRLK